MRFADNAIELDVNLEKQTAFVLTLPILWQ